MFRILQIQRSIRCLSSVRNNLAKNVGTRQPVKLYASSLAATKENYNGLEAQQSSIQNVLGDIQNNLKQFGRVTTKQIFDLSATVSRSDNINSAQALAVIRCFTDISVDSSPAERITRVQALWKRFEELGIALDVSHYNALLRVYLDSEHAFNPTDFLAKMAEGGVGPNRITYQFLVERYCQTGDVAEASRIMRFMEEKQVPIGQSVLNLMIMGHARNNDMEKAKEVLTVMKSKGFNPDESTYGVLLAEYARAGDADSIIKFFEDKENRDIFLDSRTVANVVYQLCVNKHFDLIKKVLTRAPVIVPGEYHRLVHRLASSGHIEACLSLFTHANITVGDDFFTRLGTFIIARAVREAKTAEDVLKLVKSVPKGNVQVFYTTALKPLLSGDLDLALSYISLLEKEGCEMRPQYVFPLVSRLARANNCEGLAKVLLKLKGGVTNNDVFTLYRILRHAGWNQRSSFHAMLPLRTYVAGLQICFRTALVQRQIRIAQEITSMRSRYVIGAADSVAYSSCIQTFPTEAYVNLAVSLVACGRRSSEEDSDSETEPTVAAVAEAETTATADATEEIVEEKVAGLSSKDFIRMSPQQLSDFLVERIVAVAKDDKLISLLNEFLSRGLFITTSTAEKLTAKTESDEVKTLLKQLSSNRLAVPNYRPLNEETKTELLEIYLKNEQLASQKQFIMTELLVDYATNNVSRAIELYKALDGKVEGKALRSYVQYACRNDTNVGLDCYRKYGSHQDFNWSFIQLASNLVREGKIEEALDIISTKKNFIEKNAGSHQVQYLLVTLSACPNEKAQEVLKSSVSNEDAARNLYIRQLNTLAKRDPEEAVHFYDKSFEQYGRFGFRNLAVALVTEEKYELLQKLQNVLTAKLGEEESLFELSLVLLRCHKVPQARRIIEMSNQLGRVMNRLISTGDQKSVESLLEITPPYHPRKDDVCEKLLMMYDANNDAENALALWSRFEEEGYIPTTQCLRILGNLLHRCGYEVPFEYPAEGTAASETKQKKKVDLSEETITKFEENALEHYRQNNKKKIFGLLKSLENKQEEAVRNKLVIRAFSTNDPTLLKLALPISKAARFDQIYRALGDSTIHNNYVKMMHSLVNEEGDLLKAYWLYSFLRGDEVQCKNLWKRYSSPAMLMPPARRMSLLDRDQERYWKLLKEIDAPSRTVTAAFVRMLKGKILEDVPSALELLKENAALLLRVSPMATTSLRNDFARAGATAEQLNILDQLSKENEGAVGQESS